MLSDFFLKSFRILLLPVALIYWLIVFIRNWMYDKKILSTASFGLPVICVGNLSVGGTGKSPMVEYLLEHLKDQFKVATLSRGYKRKTSGYALADENSTALEIGDEPMQFHLKFPDIPVAVGEERVEAIPQLLHDRPDTQVIILDDAFQHRAIKAGLNILLTDYNNLFTRDFYLPTGDLRDLKSGYKRADIIVVTKCKPDLSNDEKNKINAEIKPYPHQQIFFTAIQYGSPYHIISKNVTELKGKDVLLVSGIANPGSLKKYLEAQSNYYETMLYPDHHIFTIDDWYDMKNRFERLESKNKILLSTEKDAVRLMKFNNEITSVPFYIIPVQHRFLFEEGESFNGKIINFIQDFK
ncbi:MAG TPA: tetraacyldisaccharide 4'-kinase [Chitinophagaceae bacterium]|nr:tetraacyldisaccharide 4'-kinase [Chitinophagaceae bacterium]